MDGARSEGGPTAASSGGGRQGRTAIDNGVRVVSGPSLGGNGVVAVEPQAHSNVPPAVPKSLNARVQLALLRWGFGEAYHDVWADVPLRWHFSSSGHGGRSRRHDTGAQGAAA